MTINRERLSTLFDISRYRLFSGYQILLITLILLSMLLSGCSENKTYRGEIGDAKYSFNYRNEHPVNPPHPFRSGQKDVNPLSPEYFISVASHLGDSIETSLGSYRIKQDPSELKFFDITKRDTISIAGFPAEHIEYSYVGYTTIPVVYCGDFAHFKYQQYTVEIHVLFPALVGPWGSGKEAFDLLVKTFKIEE